MSSTCFEHLMFIIRITICTCSLICSVFHAFMQAVLKIYRSYEVLLLLSYSFGSLVVCFVCFYLILYIMYSYCYVYVFLLLRMFRSRYSVSLCCSVYCLCVNVSCTTITRCQPNCSYQIYHNNSQHHSRNQCV